MAYRPSEKEFKRFIEAVGAQCYSDACDPDIYSAQVQQYADEINRKNDMLKIERDPGGLSPNDPGAKLDAGKPDIDLVLGDFAVALVEVSKVGTYGAKKYSESGWKFVPNAQRRYLSAMQRHYFTYKDDELLDPDTNLSHLAHMAWNALAALTFELEKLNAKKESKTWTP